MYEKNFHSFFHVFHSKSNSFGTLELHVVKLIVILLRIVTALADLI